MCTYAIQTRHTHIRAIHKEFRVENRLAFIEMGGPTSLTRLSHALSAHVDFTINTNVQTVSVSIYSKECRKDNGTRYTNIIQSYIHD